MQRLRLLPALLALLLVLASCADQAAQPTPAPAPATAVPTAEPADPTAEPADPTAEPADPTAEPAAESAPADTWLIMLYADADDEVLEEDIFIDLNEAERVGSSANVTIVAQIDRYEGGFDGDGDSTGTQRLFITQDDDLTSIGSEVIEDLGEVNMADSQTLVDFTEWAIDTYPAARHALILSDHGMGWPGGWSDGSEADAGPDGLDLTSQGDLLLLDEIDVALDQIRADTGLEAFDLIGFDACLMGQVEVLAAMAPHARYVVASEEVEPALGWAYTSFLGELSDNPTMDGGTLATAIVNSYIDQDQRIVDDAARTEFAGEVRSADVVAAELSNDITLSAYDTAALPELLAALDNFSLALSELDKKTVASARTYAQRFENTFDDGPSPYIDLGSFAALIGEEAQIEAADTILTALGQVVIAEKHGDERPGASGLSIYFPTSKLYKSDAVGYEVYTQVAGRFAEQAAWENYLNFYYYDVPMDDVVPTDPEDIAAPGASELTVADLGLSAEEINQVDAVTVDISVEGEQVGFIYFFTGFYNPDDDSILVADIDYIDAGDTRELGGVYYPNWGEDRPVAFEYDWTPVRYGINDGTTTQFALFEPWDYGAPDESSTYVVHGNYTFANGGSRPAQLFFKDYELVKVLGFSPQGGASAPRVITPQPGDTFTVENQRILLHSDSNDPEEYITEPGATLTFGDEPFTMEELIAPAGDYVLGVQAEDMDGNIYEAYTSVTVNE